MTHIINTKIVQCLSNLNFFSGVKESIGKLLSLTQCALNDLEIRDIAQKVAHSRVGVAPVNVGILSGSNSSETFVI